MIDRFLRKLLGRKIDYGDSYFPAIQRPSSQINQRSLFLQYADPNLKPQSLDFQQVGFREFSQTDEDGILLYLFARIGMAGSVSVELGSGRPVGANTTNLIVNWGWRGLLVDGNPENVDQTRVFYKSHPDTWYAPPTAVRAWITRDNVNDLITSAIDDSMLPEIDLLSIDLDGVDYWIWDAITSISPRVVVVEYQDLWNANEARTVPYNADFVCPDTEFLYCGASLAAFQLLARRKGYRLIGFNRYQFNAFFLRQDIAQNEFPEVPVERGLSRPERQRWREEKLPLVVDNEWVEIES